MDCFNGRDANFWARIGELICERGSNGLSDAPSDRFFRLDICRLKYCYANLWLKLIDVRTVNLSINIKTDINDRTRIAINWSQHVSELIRDVKEW